MPSFKKLVESNDRGDLGAMLAKQFGGERGRTYPRGDSEFIVGFASEEQTPSIDQLRQAVAIFYGQLGYAVEMSKGSPPDVLEFFVFCHGTTKEENSIFVIISTRYRLDKGGKRENVRVNTEVLC